MTVPNQLTMLRIVLVPVFVALLLQEDPYVKLMGVIVFAVASITDAYDGYHARKYGETTRLGAFLDPLADKFLITAAFLLYVHMGYLVLWMVILVAVRDILITVLRVYAEFMDRPVVTSREAKYKTLAQNVFAYVIMVLLIMKEKVFSAVGFQRLSSRFSSPIPSITSCLPLRYLRSIPVFPILLQTGTYPFAVPEGSGKL